MIRWGRLAKHKAWELVLFEKTLITPEVRGFYFDVQWRCRGQDYLSIGVCLMVGIRTWIEFSLYDVRHVDQIPA